MALVRYIKSAAEIPVRATYVLLHYGSAKKTIRHSRGLIIILAESDPDQATFLEAVDGAKRTADEEAISTVYVIDRRRQPRTKLTS